MRTPAATRPDLRAENAKLRAELDELQATLKAIREDTVDAFVIETAHGPQVFMLEELALASSLLRDEILENISDAVIVYGDDERVMYINRAAKQRYGVSTSTALGSLIDGIFQMRWRSPEDAARYAAALRDTGTWRGEVVHVTRSGESLPLDVAVTSLSKAGRAQSVWLVVTRVALSLSSAEAQSKLEMQARER